MMFLARIMFQAYFQESKNLYTFIGKVCIFGLISVLVSICYTIWIGKLVKHLNKSIKLYKKNYFTKIYVFIFMKGVELIS